MVDPVKYAKTNFIKSRYKKVYYDEFVQRFAGKVPCDVRELYTAVTGRKPKKA